MAHTQGSPSQSSSPQSDLRRGLRTPASWLLQPEATCARGTQAGAELGDCLGGSLIGRLEAADPRHLSSHLPSHLPSHTGLVSVRGYAPGNFIAKETSHP